MAQVLRVCRLDRDKKRWREGGRPLVCNLVFYAQSTPGVIWTAVFIAHKLCYTLLQIPNASLTGPPSHLLLHSLYSHAPEPVWPSGQLGARLVSTADEHRFESAEGLLSIHKLRFMMMIMMMMMSTFTAHGTINLNAQ